MISIDELAKLYPPVSKPVLQYVPSVKGRTDHTIPHKWQQVLSGEIALSDDPNRDDFSLICGLVKAGLSDLDIWDALEGSWRLGWRLQRKGAYARRLYQKEIIKARSIVSVR